MPEIEVGQRARLTRTIEGAPWWGDGDPVQRKLYGHRGDRVVVDALYLHDGRLYPVVVHLLDDPQKWCFGVHWDEIEVIDAD